MSNRLKYESSPYLLQHAANPVDWYPWGEEAFAKAMQEQKPVLVSIGYSACHWCHVMEHESFENETVAAFMNEHFINIKVDREEHPDVDHLYMDALQAMTGAGGWPLNMFVTPDRKPFYGGTYFPPKSMYGRSSWMEVLDAIHKAWHEKPEEIALQAGQMVQHLQQASLLGTGPATGGQDPQLIHTIAANLVQQADKVYGGFGGAPKFPATGSIQFLLEYYYFHKESNPDLAAEALKHGLFSLDKMIEGGIYDQVGGGFARYATDNDWLIPHFEKMLYDNALLISVLCDAYRITSGKRYKKVIEETISFCRRELMAAGEGGFYCALDADSEGVEGKFYTWTGEQWQELMHEEHPAIAAYFGITREGNWEHTNILSASIPLPDLLQQYGLSEADWEQLLADAKQRLFRKREERVRPGTDDKILLSWNALMNAALVKASIVLEQQEYLVFAEKHIQWLLDVFASEEAGLWHVYKNGNARITAKLDDYAYLINALLSVASATGNEGYIRKAELFTLWVQEHFVQEQKSFFYFSSDTQQDIVVRKVELYDGATPAANSIMMENLWILGNLTERSAWLEQSEGMMRGMMQTVMRYPVSFSRWAVFIQRYNKGYKQLIISGPEAIPLLQGWERYYCPELFVMATNDRYSPVAAFQAKYIEGRTLLYVCEKFSCRQPLDSIEALAKELGITG
jgi:uncharacterized protein YyaL (SSP411 family)